MTPRRIPQDSGEGPNYIVSLCAVVENDIEIIADFLREAVASLSGICRYFELVIVDNHSTDGSNERIHSLTTELPNIRLIRLSRVHSREIAFSAALDHCIGDYIVTLDLRQDPLALIDEIVQRILDGADVVAGFCRQQHRSWLRRKLSAMSRKMAGYAVHARLDPNTRYCFGFSRRALNSLTRIRSKSRFILYDSRLVGYRLVLMEYDRRIRPGAQYGEEPLLSAVGSRLQMIISHSLLPLRAATLLGLAACLMNLLYIGYIFAVVLIKKKIAEGWLTTSLSHTVMFLFLFLILSVLAEYIGQILQETKDQPSYFVEQETVSSVSCYDRSHLNIV
jgi:glycosyltransferase involved in cell wall biosynthesis